ncbi:threonylcarbamoyl-AMP synthase [Ruminococcaceae bacterium OttesenSCG-928-A11]|nr:threonylcarbamoyl-AMP synthase [Ruminococcaceae bacterium OttesenSCG-928-A11]
MSGGDFEVFDTRLALADAAGVAEAAELLRGGQVVAIPTETVYGLAASAFDDAAVARIFAAKGRPQDNPLIVHIDDMAMLPAVVRQVPEAARRLAEAFWPGPLTMVLPKTEAIAPRVSAGLDTVGVRMPAHAAARAVISAAGLPLAAPSANLSGGPSPTTAAHVFEDLKGRLPLVLDGGHSPVGVESTVISLVGTPTLLRPGFVTPAELEAVLGGPVALAAGILAPPAEDLRPASPGMKYRHYAPAASITLVAGTFGQFRAFVAQKAGEGPVAALCFEGEAALLPVPAVAYGRAGDDASQAAALFGALRALDSLGIGTVYARAPGGEGVGLAVRNRLLRAAGFRMIEL